MGLRLAVFEASEKAGEQVGYDIAWSRELSNTREADLADIKSVAVERYGRARTAAGQVDLASLVVGSYGPKLSILNNHRTRLPRP